MLEELSECQKLYIEPYVILPYAWSVTEEELQEDIGRRLAFSLAFIVSVILLFL